MPNKFAKIALTAVVLLSAIGGLLWYSVQQDTAYYKHVDEVMASPEQWKGKSLQLHGFVMKGSWGQKKNTLEYQFKVENKGKVVRVVPAFFPTPSRKRPRSSEGRLTMTIRRDPTA
jgi:cytochrome c-type biogenesis protein CcmE